MKKIVLFLTISFNICVLFGQTFTENNIVYDEITVYTCNGGMLTAGIARREVTAQELEYDDDRYLHPNGTYNFLELTTSNVIGAYTSQYNCHTYAWHITEGDQMMVWIKGGNLGRHWNPEYGCFGACAKSEAEKIHYNYGNHSAVKSTVAGMYESKWGAWRIIRHYPDQVPYWSGNKEYYKKVPTITGPNNDLCYGSSDFYLINPPSGNITWEVSESFSVSPANGDQTTVTRTGPGSATLTAKVNGTTVATRDISCMVSVVDFINIQPVSADIYVTSMGVINVQNVTVNAPATLTIDAANNIALQNVTVNSGATLILDAGGQTNIGTGLNIQPGANFQIIP